MNYTIIGHTEDTSYRDHCGDWVSRPGKFETHFFREEQKAKFLKQWAHAKYHNMYENLIILLDGIPDGYLENDEYDKYEDLEREMYVLHTAIHAEHEAAEAIRKESAARAAEEKARQLAQAERERDLQQLRALQQKLNIKETT